MGGYVFLASYPKSGNTWLRLMLLCAQAGQAAVDINGLEATAPGLTRPLFDEIVGGDSEDLTLDEIDALRPFYHREVARIAGDRTLLCRTHDRWRAADGVPVIPPDACRAVIYITRDPRDVAVSLAHYENRSIDAAIIRMANPHARVATQWALRPDIPQVQGTWSQHVLSWLDDCPIPLLHLRYEDMVSDAATAFARAIRTAGLQASDALIASILDSARFYRLRKQEIESGYVARPAATAAFFREGRAGQWRERLSADQIRRIEQDHAIAMRRAGYVPTQL
jgi:aryl sulfotransferase